MSGWGKEKVRWERAGDKQDLRRMGMSGRGGGMGWVVKPYGILACRGGEAG
jgi:hypothetical protein